MRRNNATRQALAGLLLIITIALAGCSGSANPETGTAVTEAPATQVEPLDLPVNIDAATVDQIREREDVFVVDVREDWEYAAGHVPGATLIPLGQLPDRLADIPSDKAVVAVCRSGNRSGQATEFLLQQGYDVHNMQGGMVSWEQAGLQIEK